MSSVAVASRPGPAAAVGARVWLPCCLVCNRELADSELATCRDAHAACPAQPDVTFLQKVRAAAPLASWMDGRPPADLVCPRCAALINDIVIYESRLADMTQQLVSMVTHTTATRTAAADSAASSSSAAAAAADKPKTRRPRKVPPKKSKPATNDDTAPSKAETETNDVAEPRPHRQRSTVSLADIEDPEDADDPTEFEDGAEPGEEMGLEIAEQSKSQADPTWVVTTEPVVRRRGRPPSNRPTTCPLCNKRYATASSLTKHMQLHSGERKFKCATCGKAFMDRRALQRHEVDHTGVRPFCCSDCGKTLLSSHALRIHQRAHQGIKPVECHVCNKRMSSAQMLREHLRIHTGERPYSCEMCGKTFRTERIFSSHQRTHTGVRPHVCDVCGRAFSQRTPLTAHLRTHSAEELEAVKRERIGRTAVRTAAGIFDAKDGRSMPPLTGASEQDAPSTVVGVPVSATGPASAPVFAPPNESGAAPPAGPNGVTQTETEAAATLAALVPVCHFMEGSGAVAGAVGDGVADAAGVAGVGAAGGEIACPVSTV